MEVGLPSRTSKNKGVAMFRKYNKFLLSLLLASCILLLASNAYASNVAVSDAEIKNLDLDAETARIYFKVSQDSPYAEAVLGARDYIWIFAKYWMNGEDSESTGWHSVTLEEDKFILASSADGTTSFYLSWDFSGAADEDLVSHLSSGEQIKVKVGAIEMVKVPANGSVSSFYIAKYEVSQDQYVDYLNLLDATTAQQRWTDTTNNGYTISYSSAADYGSRYSCTASERAVNFISYTDATSYVDWVGLRLPTEVEFEKAAQGPAEISGEENSRLYPWGDTIPTTGNSAYSSGDYSGHYQYYANFGNLDDGKKPVDVGVYQSGDITRSSAQTGVSPFSIPDLAGNVAEWIKDSEVDYGLKGGGFASDTDALKLETPNTIPSTYEEAGLRPAK